MEFRMNAPVKKFRNGAISVDIWQNSNEKGNFYSFSIQKVYKNDKDEWATTNNFSPVDGLKLSHLLKLANDWVVQQ
jgi:hypothetical protein